MLAIIFQIILVVATLCVALVAGLLFAFAVVAMPGLKNLNDGEFIRAFQQIDGVIQNNQPVFMLVWMGSVLLLIAAAVVGFGQLQGVQQILMIAAVTLYILGVQAPTVGINVPLNNEIQTVETMEVGATELQEARARFENRWNGSNQFRAFVSIVVTTLLIVLLLLL